MRLALRASALSIVLFACGGPASTTSPSASSPNASSPPSASPGRGQEATPGGTASAAPPAPEPARARPDESEIFARLQPDLTACYERGRKAAPNMGDGRLTLNAAIDAAGTTTCVIPNDDKGLTQEVEDCMSARLAAERFGEGPPSTVSVRVAVRGGKVEPGTAAREVGAFDSVETHRMPDAFDALETIVPKLQECVRAIDRSLGVRSVIVAARVATSGQTQCAIASGAPVSLPPKAAECTANVLRQTTFPKPSGGPGLILVPIALGRR